MSGTLFAPFTRTRWRALGALTTAFAVVVAGLTLSTGTATAAPGTITGATFEWTVNPEVQSAPPVGGCNYLSAGASDGTQATYAATAGNVAIVKDGAAPTWANHCTLTAGSANQKVVLSGGTGTLDPATGASTIQFTGTFSVSFYGGMAPWSVTDPILTVNASGAGTLKGDLSGYGSSQENPNVKVPLTPVNDVVIASFSGANGANTTGFTVTPAYAGVTYDVPAGSDGTPQNRTTTGWGAWPSDFVDFQFDTGLMSYWYSSGGAADAKKAPAPFTVAYGTFTPSTPTGTPATTVTPNANLDPTVANTVTVNGSGFSTLPSGAAGVYVGFVPAATWQPGQSPNQAAFVGTQFVPAGQITNGAFTTAVTVPAGTVTDTSATYGIGTFCAHACSLTNRTLDTFSAVGFTAGPTPPTDDQQTITTTVTEEPGEFSWTIDAADHNVLLTNAVNEGSFLHATGQLKPVKVTDTRSGAPAWSVTGQVGDFTGGVSGKYLGWTPKVTAAGAGATAGAAVASGIDTGNGLKTSSQLGSAPAGHAKGTGSVGADLDLRLPAETAPGTYTATLTITALG